MKKLNVHPQLQNAPVYYEDEYGNTWYTILRKISLGEFSRNLQIGRMKMIDGKIVAKLTLNNQPLRIDK